MVRREGRERDRGTSGRGMVRTSSWASGTPPVPTAVTSSLNGECGWCPIWFQLGQVRSRPPRSTLIWEIPAYKRTINPVLPRPVSWRVGPLPPTREPAIMEASF
jgi:hypothetical protein